MRFLPLVVHRGLSLSIKHSHLFSIRGNHRCLQTQYDDKLVLVDELCRFLIHFTKKTKWVLLCGTKRKCKIAILMLATVQSKYVRNMTTLPSSTFFAAKKMQPHDWRAQTSTSNCSFTKENNSFVLSR